MEDINFDDDVSYGGQQLGIKINDALQEYDSITKKMKGKNKGLNIGLNNDYPYKTPLKFNNYKYKKNSPFISTLQNDYSYPNTFRGNLNFNDSRIFNTKTKNLETNDLLEEFKETLEKSRIIKDDLMKMNSNSKFANKYKNKKNNYFYKNKINFPYKFYPNKTFNENDFEEEKSSTSNGMTTLDSISKGLDMFDKINRKKSKKKEGHKNLKASEKEKKKLENESKALIDKYQEIKKDNRILEIEISNYKKLANQYLNFGNNYKNKFNNKYSQKTINELEQSVKQNIQNNCLIIDTILKIQKNNEILSSKIESLSNKMKLNFQKIEKKNRKNAEIQITNEENEQKVLNLKDEKQNLLHELETQKIYLMKLKYKEDNLNLLNESNKKALNDKEEHILKLKNTINQYNKYKNKFQKNSSFTNDNMQAYDEKINNLKIEINNLNSIKQKILVSNSNVQKQILSLNPNNLDNNNDQQLNDQLNEIKIENTQKKISLKEKENQLELLKNEIDSFTLNIKNNNQIDEIQKNKIKNLINVIDSSENNQ